MPHTRIRFIKEAIELSIKAGAITGVIGQRQTGKTTLISQYAKEYATFDRPSELEVASLDAMEYLKGKKHPFAIDECQLCPPLFPALKEWVRINPKHGQFILSGSIRFTSRKQIKESLTGRIILHELLPFSIAESHSLKPVLAHQIESFRKIPRFKAEKLTQFFDTGGLPGICFGRNEKLRNRSFELQISTLLDRDLRLLLNTKLSYTTLKNILVELGKQAGEALDLSTLSRSTRVSRITLRNLLSVFESMFIIRTIQCEGGMKAPIILFEDVGFLNYLTQGRNSHATLLLNAFYQCIRLPYYYSFDQSFSFFQYRTRGGAFVPLGIHLKNQTIGWIFTNLSHADSSTLKSAQSFLKKYPKGLIFILGPNMKFQTLTPKIITGNLMSAF